MDHKLTPERIKLIATATRLEEIRKKVEIMLGSAYLDTVREYYPSIRNFMRKRKMNCIAVASSVGEELHQEGKNPLPFIAACVQFGKDNPNL